MAVKKSKKTVLEYDPLSWLKEEADDVPDAENKAKKAVEEKPQVQAESSTDNNVVEGAHFGFFDEDEPVQPEDDNNTGGSISLGSELTIKNIARFKQVVDDSLAQQKDICIDPTELQKIDTAGLQLLFCLQQSLQKSGHRIDWVARSEVVESASKIIGIENLFDNAAESIEQDQGFGFF